jgi:hypothetical protein
MTNKTPGQIILDAVANGQYNAASEIMSAELFSNVNECMCQRKEKVASDFGQAISEGDSAYDTFFKKAMKKFGISSPGDLKGEEEKKKFFNYIDKNFKGQNEGYGGMPREMEMGMGMMGRDDEEEYEYEMDMGMMDRDDEEEYEYEMDMGMMGRDDEEEYEYEMDMMSVMPDDEEDGKPDQAFPPRRIKDQGGPGQMQGQMPMGAAPGKMMGGMQAPMQGMGQGMGQGMQMNPQMIAKLMQMMKQRKGGM